jgi:alkyl hydroperoxide reductase subunit AhpC
MTPLRPGQPGPDCTPDQTEPRKLPFPLLSDFEPKGDVSLAYGVCDHESGTSGRALFVLDEAGVIQWSYLSPVALNPGADGILAALEAMDTRKVPQ